jgi:hypothetical protein
MSHLECLSLIYIATQARTDDGTWIGSAGALAGEIGINARTARDVLENLDEKGYVKRWPVPGRHVCYPIRVHKYPTTTGEHDGDLVDALSSTGPADCRWLPAESRQQHGEENVERGAQRDGNLRAVQKRSENLEDRIMNDTLHGQATQHNASKNSEAKSKFNPDNPFHWEWFEELFRFYFREFPTGGKKQRKKYAERCRDDGEKWVLLSLMEFAEDAKNNGFDDVSAAGWVFLTTAYEDYRFTERSKADSDPTTSYWWPESEVAPFFAKWFRGPVAAQAKAAAASKNR